MALATTIRSRSAPRLADRCQSVRGNGAIGSARNHKKTEEAVKFSTILLGCAAALAVLAAPGGVAHAQDTEHVTWNDDGTVTLRTDPEYEGEWTIPQEMLGGLFGPGEKPFEGEAITVLTLPLVNRAGPNMAGFSHS
jgi:hypothetical protein